MSTDQSSSTDEDMARFTRNTIMGTRFEITARTNKPLLNVSSAKDQITRRSVAVKKLHEPFKSSTIAKHIFREIKLLKYLQHENIVHLNDILISPSEDMYASCQSTI
ncbi:Mitogen-activated protein kinase HOG1 [Penicillium chrysogenum]|uniref:Mitogen-activated protein kinase HOG1 n=1 Tax=Penicillium chrysogenum TaxID=5076 RepID=A0ABQ8WWM0_PENCH|nr:Mitogen-activated protein kinase HOG1 [Penicillium chrysogenum]